MQSAQDFVDLHDQVQASVNLLSSLQGFLSTFQKDLSTVSGQIADLQSRSRGIDDRLNSRKKIEKSLSHLLAEISVSPSLVTMILDTEVDDDWLNGIFDFERVLGALQPRSKLKATRDLYPLVEGMRIAAATKLRSFFLAFLTPLKASMSTNLPVLQSTALMKYHSLFGFLQRHAPPVAVEFQMAYVAAVRTYYETGFRRYTRSLGNIKNRNVIKSQIITSTEQVGNSAIEPEQLMQQTTVQGVGVTLSFMAEDQSYVEPVHLLFRSMEMVLLDNATVEYQFLSRFFVKSPVTANESRQVFDDPSSPNEPGTFLEGIDRNLEQRTIDVLWNQVFEPACGHCKVFVDNALSTTPSATLLLAMIKMNDSAIAESQLRQCPPLEGFLFSLRLLMWPVFQKDMNSQVESVKRLTDGSGGLFTSKSSIRVAQIHAIASRYANFFISFASLCSEDDSIVFSNLARLREELIRLMATKFSKIADPQESAESKLVVIDIVMQSLTVMSHDFSSDLSLKEYWSSQHVPSLLHRPNGQAELAFWKEKRAEAERRAINRK